MIGALTVCGLTTMMTIEGGTDAAVFLAFVTEVLGPRLTPGDMVILDNAGAHKDARIKDAVEARGAKLVFLRMRSTSDALPPDANFRDLRARADGPLGRRAWRADEQRIGRGGSRLWTRGGAPG
jgi:hypothetical protein